jgi:hypothetical protein
MLRWLMFGIVSAIVFGYQLHDFWSRRRRLVFWMSLALMFLFHYEFWAHYVFPTYGDHPGLFTVFLIAVIEYAVVTIAVKLMIPLETK